MKIVNVLMSTYNGEKYIEEQIKSILRQRGVKVILTIRDDGSSDNTCKIIRKYENKKNVQVIYGKNIYLTNSFFELMKYAQYADYYAFSDQDDVWEENKLNEAIKLLEKSDSELKLYYSGLKVADRDAIYTGKDLFDSKEISFKRCMVINRAAGCTMVFNNGLLNRVRNKLPQYARMHDHWILLVCLGLNGYVYRDDNAYILYRQHADNSVGANRDVKKYVKGLIEQRRRKKCGRSKQVEEFIKLFGDFLNNEKYMEALILTRYKNSLHSKYKAWHYFKIYFTESIFQKIIFFISIMVGEF